MTIYKLGENICKSHIWQRLHPKYIQNSQNSSVRKQTTQYKNGQKMTRTDISPKRQASTLKDVSTSLAIREMLIEATMTYHTSVRMTKI